MGIKLALCQYSSETDNVGANLNKIMAAISHNRADMYIFPELFLTGPGADHALHEDEIQYAVDKMRLWCMERDIAIVVGAHSPGNAGSSVIFITLDDIVKHGGAYHTHSEPYSDVGFAKSSKPVAYSFKEMTFGLTVCGDLFNPEAYGTADVNICIAAATERTKQYCDRLLPARSLDNLSYTVFVNGSGIASAGSNLCGSSRLIGPLGDTLGELGEKEGVLCVYVDNDVIKNAKRVKASI
jgi:predicted amidohydrolase